MKNQQQPLQDLPLDAHPGAVKGESPLLNPARKASETLWATWNKLRDAERNVSDKHKLAPLAQKAVERALSSTDKALSALQKNRDTVDAKINQTVLLKTPDALGFEIRAHFKSAKSPFTEVATLVRKGDHRSVAAILNAPAYLSGLTNEQHSTLLELAQKQFCPEETRTLADIDRAAGRLQLTAAHITETLAPRIKEWTGTDDKALEDLQNHEK